MGDEACGQTTRCIAWWRLKKSNFNSYIYTISSQAPQKQKRRPKTPAGATLPLGGYEDKRKALEKERNEDMRKELAKVGISFLLFDVFLQKIWFETKSIRIGRRMHILYWYCIGCFVSIQNHFEKHWKFVLQLRFFILFCVCYFASDYFAAFAVM